MHEEARGRAMHALTVIKATADERHDVRDGLWSLDRKCLECERALGGLDHDQGRGFDLGERARAHITAGQHQSTHCESGEPTCHAVALTGTVLETLVTPTRGHMSASTHSPHRGYTGRHTF